MSYFNGASWISSVKALLHVARNNMLDYLKIVYLLNKDDYYSGIYINAKGQRIVINVKDKEFNFKYGRL